MCGEIVSRVFWRITESVDRKTIIYIRHLCVNCKKVGKLKCSLKSHGTWTGFGFMGFTTSKTKQHLRKHATKQADKTHIQTLNKIRGNVANAIFYDITIPPICNICKEKIW